LRVFISVGTNHVILRSEGTKDLKMAQAGARACACAF